MMQFARTLATSTGAAMSAAPAVAVKSSGGIASILGFGKSRLDVPLSEALPNVPQPLRSSLPSVAPQLQTSVVDGTTIATIDKVGSPVSTVAVVLPGGSAYETEATAGASKVLEQLAFKATANRTTFRLTRELEKIGAVAYARAGRDTISFAVDSTRIHTSEATEILLDSVLNPKFNYWEVREAVQVVRDQLAQALTQPANVLAEVVHRAAYDGSLGQPLLLDPSALEGFSNDTLKEFASGLLQPSKMLLAGAGIAHAEFKALAHPLVGSAHPGAALAAPKASAYVGGSVNVLASSGLTHVALAFEAKGGLSDAKTAALAAVSRALLDDSRAVLPWMHKGGVVGASAFSYLYKDTGLVGVSAAAAPQQASALVDAVCKRVEGVAKGASEPQLKQAKQVAVAAYKASLSTTAGALAVMGPQLLASGKFDVADFVSKVEAITSADVSAFMLKSLKSAPTFATYGSLSHMPRYDNIAKRFN